MMRRISPGTLHLTQVGETVIGSAETSGGGSLYFDSTLSAFNGTWGYGARPTNGAIAAKKIASTDF